MNTIVKFPLVNNASIVSEKNRLDFLPSMCMNNSFLFLNLEQLVYEYARKNDPNYNGGYWEFVRITENIGFLYPELNRKMILKTAYDDIEVDNVTFGLVCTMLACNYLCFTLKNKNSVEIMCNLYLQLKDWFFDDKTLVSVSEKIGVDECKKIYKSVYKALD